MRPNETVSGCWHRLRGDRSEIEARWEFFASLTVPKVYLPEGITVENSPIVNDYQSVGATAVKHVTNKLMMALFPPGRPFFKVQPSDEWYAKTASDSGLGRTDIDPLLAKVEVTACKRLDARAQRPKLFQMLRYLVVLGNVLEDSSDPDHLRIIGPKKWVVKRADDGYPSTLIIRNELAFEDLDYAIQNLQPKDIGGNGPALRNRYQPSTTVSHYLLLERTSDGKRMELSQWVDNIRLPQQYNGRWTLDTCPYRIKTWDLQDGDSYGTGLVEEHAGDLKALSILSEGALDGGVLSAELRWLVSPAGMTDVEAFKASKSGDAVSGREEDIDVVSGAVLAPALKVLDEVISKYERRIGRAFLLNSAVTRNAERVTAEETRMNAQELETSFGGNYTSLASQIQRPIAIWCMGQQAVKIDSKEVDVVVITGLDALSRNADLDNLTTAFANLSNLNQLPPQFIARLKDDALIQFIGQCLGIDLTPFIKSAEEMQAEQQQQQAAAQANSFAESSGAAAGDAAVNQGQPA